MGSPVNRAVTDEVDVRLVSVADDVDTDDEWLFDESDDADTATVLFFKIENVGDEPIEWWCDEHDVLDTERFQYATDEAFGDGFDGGFGGSRTVDWLPAHWYAKLRIRPDARARCVTAAREFPSDASLDRLYYEYDGVEYELRVEREELDPPPV